MVEREIEMITATDLPTILGPTFCLIVGLADGDMGKVVIGSSDDSYDGESEDWDFADFSAQDTLDFLNERGATVVGWE